MERCMTCKHFQRRYEWRTGKEDDHGTCPLTETFGVPPPTGEGWAFADGHGYPILVVHEQFGCIRWEQREDHV